MSGNGVTISILSTGTASLSTLIFDPLRTSHGDIYKCYGTLISPALNAPNTSSPFETVVVQSMSYLFLYYTFYRP